MIKLPKQYNMIFGFKVQEKFSLLIEFEKKYKSVVHSLVLKMLNKKEDNFN